MTCEYVGADLLLYSNVRIECGSPTHIMWVLFVALPAILVYGIVMPVGVLLGMRASWVLESDHWEETTNKHWKHFNEPELRMYGSLMKDYLSLSRTLTVIVTLTLTLTLTLILTLTLTLTLTRP